MDIKILTQFQLKMILIGESIAKSVILLPIWTIFRPSLAQIMSKIAKFDIIFKFSDLNHVNTSTDPVSAQNYPSDMEGSVP